METASLVLGSISLIEYHVKAASAFSSWWKHKNELDCMCLALDAERTLFLEFGKQLLTHIVPSNELESLLQNPSSSAWRSAELDLTLKCYLEDNYCHFSHVMDGIASALDILKTFLHLDTNGKTSLDDLSFREQQWKRLTLSLSRWYLCELINYIQNSNRMLADLKNHVIESKADRKERSEELRAAATSNNFLLSRLDECSSGTSNSIHPSSRVETVDPHRLLQTVLPGNTTLSDVPTAVFPYQSSSIPQQTPRPYATEESLRVRDKGIDAEPLSSIGKLSTQFGALPEGSDAMTAICRTQHVLQQVSSNDDEICAQQSQAHTIQGHQRLDELLNHLLADRISIMSHESRLRSHSSLRTYNILVFAECFVILASFIVSLTWSLVRQDVQGGFTIGAYIIGAGTLLVAGIKAHFEKHAKRRMHDIEL